MKKRLPIILIILLFFIGLAVMLYPTISNAYNQFHQTKVIDNFDHSVNLLEDEDLIAEKEAAYAYNLSLIDNVILTDPFDNKASEKTSDEYQALLNIGQDGVMGHIDIPKIKLNLPIYHGTSSETLAKGVGHMEKTSLPVGGIGTHAVLSAHTGSPSAELFTDLIKLEAGDVFYLTILDDILAYQVDQIHVVEPSNTSDLKIDRVNDYVTLVTCTPYGVNSHRLLVRGTRIDYVESVEIVESQQEEGRGIQWLYPYIIAGIVLLLILISFFLISCRRRRRL